MLSLLSPLRYLAQALAAQDTPRQVAAGFALGAVAGLIPKSSLLAHIPLILLSASQANLGAGMVAAALFSLLGRLLDPLLDSIGRTFLTQEALRGLWTWAYNIPVVPWTQFNNTVVLGACVVGLAAAYPLYRAAIPAIEHARDKYGERLRKYWIVQALLGADLASRLRGAP